MSRNKQLAVIPMCLVLASCSSTDERSSERAEAYINAGYYERLELPPDLTVPSFNKELIIPEPSASARDRFQQQSGKLQSSADAAEVTATGVILAGAAIQRDGDQRWLQVEDDAKTIWAALRQFMLHEGLPVIRQEPQIGLMETDWVVKYRLTGEEGFFQSFFTTWEPDNVDSFVFRMEQAEAGATRVYVSHTMKERLVEGDDVNWATRGGDAAIEAEVLQRLALYLGAAQSASQASAYRPFAIRVRQSDFDSNSLEVVGGAEHVHKRVLEALQSIGIENIEQAGENIIGIDLAGSKAVIAQDAEEDEFAQSSFIMQWFKGEAEEDGSNRLQLKLTALDTHTRLDFQDPDGELSASVLAEQLSKRVRDQLM